MRETKFRTWDKVRHSFSYFTLQKLAKSEFDPTDWIDEAEWQEFTGLKDKNGKEIFEGDMIKTRCRETQEKEKIGKVEWLENMAGFEFNCNSSVMSSECMSYSQHIFEVIGNIYENPELLKSN